MRNCEISTPTQPLSTNNSLLSFDLTCRMGNAKAAVFPDPVSASPMTSCPSNATGMASRWMAEGFFHPSLSQAEHSTSTRPREEKVASLSSGVGPFSTSEPV